MEASHEKTRSWSRRDTLTLVGLMAMALAVRVPQLISPYVINPDAIDYIGSAKALVHGKWMEGLLISHASIFPVLIALLQPLGGDWVATARGVTMFFGLTTVVPLYLVSRRVLAWPLALIPAVLYCLCPSLTHYSMDVIREPISWFFLFAALWALLRAEDSRRWIWYVVAGVFLLVGVANRLDGLLGLGVGAAWLLGKGLITRSLLRAFKGAALLAAPFLLAVSAMSPFFLGMQHRHDLLELGTYKRQIQMALREPEQTQRARIEAILEGISQPRLRNFFSSAWENRRALAAWDLLRHWVRAAHPALLAFSLLGLSAWGGWRGQGSWWLLLLVLVAWLLLGYVRLSGAFAISRRHLGPLVLSGYFFAAMGFLEASRWIAQKRWGRLFGAAPWGLLLLCGLLTLPWTVQPQRTDKIVRRAAGEWIKAQGLQAPVVATEHQIVAFYSEGVWLPLKELRAGSNTMPDFLVLDEGDSMEKAMQAIRGSGLRAEQLERVEHSGNTLLIYRVSRVQSHGVQGIVGGIGQPPGVKGELGP
jgi:4-amino-4-deoxy-L-arabinose transferase-like glycosyltransferase